MLARKRKQSVLDKTPASMLKELCDHENFELRLDQFTYETNLQMFICHVTAFSVSAKGSGRSKQEAKQEACANVIGE